MTTRRGLFGFLAALPLAAIAGVAAAKETEWVKGDVVTANIFKQGSLATYYGSYITDASTSLGSVGQCRATNPAFHIMDSAPVEATHGDMWKDTSSPNESVLHYRLHDEWVVVARYAPGQNLIENSAFVSGQEGWNSAGKSYS